MNLKQYSPEEQKELSMIELAFIILENKKQATSFKEIVKEITDSLGLSHEELVSKLSQFYTDLNIDGRFICMGENTWGLRGWYPYEQIDEEVLPQPKPKKKRKKDDDEPVVLEDDFDDPDELAEEDSLGEEEDLDEDFTDEDEEDEEDQDFDDVFDEDEDEDEEDELEKEGVFVEGEEEDTDEDDDNSGK